MKKFISVLLVTVLALGLFGCGNSAPENTTAPASTETAVEETPTDQPADASTFPFEGTWLNEQNSGCFRIYDDGTLLYESIATTTSTTTRNGKTITKKSPSIYQQDYTWALDGDKFVFDGTAEYSLVVNDGVYKLVGKKVTYVRVGDIDFELKLKFSAE